MRAFLTAVLLAMCLHAQCVFADDRDRWTYEPHPELADEYGADAERQAAAREHRGVMTQTDDAYYVHVLDAAVNEVHLDIHEPMLKATLPSGGAAVDMNAGIDGYRLTLPSPGRNEWVRVVKLSR